MSCGIRTWPISGCTRPCINLPFARPPPPMPGANRQIDEGVESLGGAPAPLAQRRGVHIGIEADRHFERRLDRPHDIHVGPARLRRRRDEAERVGAGVQINRTERGDADGRQLPEARLGRPEEVDGLAKRALRRGRGESHLLSHVPRARPDHAHELGSAGLHCAAEQFPFRHRRDHTERRGHTRAEVAIRPAGNTSNRSSGRVGYTRSVITVSPSSAKTSSTERSKKTRTVSGPSRRRSGPLCRPG